MKHYLVELIGTFFLVLAVALGNPIAIGAMLVGLTYMGWQISGAHFNPAITTAVAVNARTDRMEYLYYILAQICGAILGASFWHCIMRDQIRLDPGQGQTWQLFTYEAVMAFLLCMVVLAVLDLFKKKAVNEYGLAIGATYAAIIFLRGVANPAVAAGVIIFSMIMGAPSSMITPLLGYLVGPLIGGFAAARAYTYVSKG